MHMHKQKTSIATCMTDMMKIYPRENEQVNDHSLKHISNLNVASWYSILKIKENRT